MCCRSTRTIVSTSAGVMFFKMAVLLFVFCFAECATGSCLSYGHSCWGAHGKRNGGGPGPGTGALVRVYGGSAPGSTRWYLSRLVQAPAGLDLFKKTESGTATGYFSRKQLQNDSDLDADLKSNPEERDDAHAERSAEDSEAEKDADADADGMLAVEPASTARRALRLYDLVVKARSPAGARMNRRLFQKTDPAPFK